MKLVFEVMSEPVTQASIRGDRLLIWRPHLDCNLLVQPFGLHPLCDRFGYHRLFGSALGSSLSDRF